MTRSGCTVKDFFVKEIRTEYDRKNIIFLLDKSLRIGYIIYVTRVESLTLSLRETKKSFTFYLTNLVNMLYYIRDAKLPNNCTVVTNFTGEKVKKNT